MRPVWSREKIGIVKARRSLLAALAGLVLCAIAVALVWTKPWARSVMYVRVTISTDDAPTALVYSASKLFDESGRSLPVYRAEIDLGRWEGELIRLDVEGKTARRGMPDSSTGFLACEADLLDSNGVTPVEFVGWEAAGDATLHCGPLGPRSCRLQGPDAGRFAFAKKGTVWHAFRVPSGARLQLRLKPVPALRLENRIEPYVPADLAAADAPLSLPGRRPERPPDVFIYVIDALRADHLGCYGYNRDTSPAIDAFAAEATLFEDAHTAATWTRPSVATILSGLYASVHGVVHYGDGLADWPVLLPEILREVGYGTRAYVTNGHVTPAMGFDQGWDDLAYLQAPAGWVNAMAERALAQEDPDRPVFLYLHTVEPHGPYTPRPENLRRFDRGFKGRCDGSQEALDALDVLYPDLSEEDVQHLLDRYDADVYEADQGFAGFLEVLRNAGRYEDSLILLVSDHGEAFCEHDTFGHGWELNQEDMHILFAVRFPQNRHGGVRVAERASLIDIMPTILSEVGVRPELPYELPGRRLEQLVKLAAPRPSRRIYAETCYWDSNDLDLVCVIDEDGFKRVVDVSVPPQETATKKSLGLWDTRADPREETDLAEELPVRAAYDEILIARWMWEQRHWRERSAVAPAPKVDITDAVRQQLGALGYVGGGPP
jgi:arylsulfatase A-like enzyme